MRKKGIILLIVLTISTWVTAQSVVFHENFELPSQADSVTATTGVTGGNTWTVTNNLSAEGISSDSCHVSMNDTSYLTTNAFSTLGNNGVLLEFKHICKIEWMDAAEIYISADNGVNWTKLTENEYLGSGYFSTSPGNKFTAISYINDWQAINNNAIPDNSWWKSEKFTISAIAGNASQVKVRFVLRDGNSTGAAGNYGWLIDDIKVSAAPGELIPPVVSMKAPLLQDTVNNTGPFDIYAHVTDASGIDTAFIVYNLNAGTNDTVSMSLISDSTYHGYIPSQSYNTSICYYVVAIDASSSSNSSKEPGFGCTEIYTKQGPEYFQVGQSMQDGYKAPVYIQGATSSQKYSNHISLFDFSEMSFNGLIENIAWNKSNAHGYTIGDGELKIYLKHTTTDTVSASTSFAAELTSAILVYSSTTQDLNVSVGWQTFNFNTANTFSYNGIDNLMILVEWYRPSAATGEVKWFYHGATGKAITFYGSTANPTTSTGLSDRPDILFGYYSNPVNNDVGMYQYISPKGKKLSGSPMPVKMRIKNYGTDTLQKATINWTIDGAPQIPYIWTGSLNHHFVSGDITISNPVFSTGPHTIKAWGLLPNDSVDENPYNDTIKESFFVCNQILNGVYTIGGASADFQTFAGVIDILNNCGVNGPVTLNINPGTYNEQILLTSNINGLSAVNTITLQSSTGNKADVILSYASQSSNEDYVIKVDGIEHISIKKVTIQATGTSFGSAIVLTGGVKYAEISNNTIICPAGNIYGAQGISITKGSNNLADNGNCVIKNNTIINGNSGITIYGTSSLPEKGILIQENVIRGFFATGISAYYTDSAIIISNEIVSSTSSASSKGIYLSYSASANEVVKNTIVLTASGYAPKGIEINRCNASSTEPNKFINNFISLNGSSTSSVASAIYINSGSFNHFFYNSLNVNTGSSLSASIYVNYSTTAGGGFNRFKNNNVAHNNGGYALEVTSLAATNNLIAYSDYNNLYASGAILAKWGNTAIAVSSGISGLTASSTMDSNSVSVYPGFYSPVNLHTFSQTLDGAGDSIAGITEDYDDDIRDVSTPDIGADEFTLSTVDAGIVSVLEPLAVDTQNNVVAVRIIARNFGLGSITSMNIKYTVNNGTAVNYTWTGTLAPGSVDTVSLQNMTIPVGMYNLCFYTELNGDTLNYNDSLCVNYQGLPLQNAEMVTLINPFDGCDQSLETVTVKIVNAGVGVINGGLNAHYQITGSSTIVTEAVTATILPGDTTTYNFTTKADLSVSGVDSIFEFKVFVSLTGDLLNTKDTIIATVLSLSNLASPQINDTTINYGDSVTLSLISPYPINWYDSDTASTTISTGASYTTPALFDTTTYFVQANEAVPSMEVIIGTGTQSNTSGTFPNPYVGQGQSNRQQFLYLASELNNMGLNVNTLEYVAFDIASTNGLTKLEGIEIKIGHTTTGALSNWQTGLTTVYSASIYPTNYPLQYLSTGWNIHDLLVPFAWNGSDNIVVEICYSSYSFGGINASVRHSVTPYTSSGNIQQNGACSATGFTGLTKRPNIKFKTVGALGCSSLRTPLKVNVPLPYHDIILAEILTPSSGCGLATSDVSIRLINHGLNTVNGGLTATYRIDTGAYITPETISNIIFPGDTLEYTFITQASLPSGNYGTDYTITAKAIYVGDIYHGNDTMVKSSITSEYTPVAPYVVSPVVTNYGDSVIITATAIDTIYWYSDSLGLYQIGTGSQITAGPVFDTTIYYASTQKVVPPTPYTIGNGTSLNTLSVGPSPYGAQSYLAWGLKNQFLIRASEMKAMGMLPGEIESLAFNVGTVSGNSHQNYTIQIGTTNQNELNNFESGLTTVWSSIGHSESASWNTYNFNQPFYWDGSSNIVIQTCFKNTAWVTTGYAPVYYTATSYISSMNSYSGINFTCNDTIIDNQYYKRPNIRFIANGYGVCKSDFVPVQVNVTSFPPVDAGINQIVNPVTSVSSTVSTPVKVVLQNYGSNTLTNVTINWSDRGNIQTAYNWTGSLLQNETDTVLVDNHYFKGGQTEILAWVINPNNVADTINTNDTASVNISICMSGNYTIGQSLSDYSTVQDAVDDLTLSSVCAPVIFDIDSGLYTEQIEIPEISGAGTNSTITFQSATGDSSDVTIQYAPSGTTNYTISLDGADYFIFKNLTIIVNGSAGQRTIELSAGSNHNQFKNNVITGPVSTSSSSAAIYSYSQDNDYNRFENNLITNGYHGIYIKSINPGGNKGAMILNNTISEFYKYGIYAFYQDSIIISNNEITNGSIISSSVTGIFMLSSNGAHEITANKVILDGGSGGTILRYYNCDGTAAHPALIANNFLVMNNSTGFSYGLDVTGSNYTKVYYNSIRIGNGSTTACALRTGSSGSNLKVKNNIFSNFGPGYAIYVPITSSVSVFDYNNIYTDTTSGNYAFWVANVNGLAALKQLSGTLNQNSIGVDPGFILPTDLHTLEIALNANGSPASGITTDIDGETRNATTPDIGADEFTPAPYDLGAIAMISPQIGDCFDANMTVVVRIKNYGLNALNFAIDTAFVNVVVTGTSPSPIIPLQLNTGTLAVGATMDVTVTSTFDMSVAGTYTFNAYTSSSWDSTAVNDALLAVTMNINPVITTFPFDEDFETFQPGSGSSSNPGTIENGWTIGSDDVNLRWYPKTGATPTSSTGPQGDHTTGLGNYIYFESSYGSVGSSAWFTSNCLDLSSFTNPVVKYYYHMFGSGIGTLYVEAMDTSGNFIIIDSIAGQQQNSSTDPWLLESSSLNNYTNAYTRVRFRAVKVTGTGDIAIDDILILEPSNIDLGVKYLLQPTLLHAPTGTTVNIEIEIENYGNDTLTVIPLGYTYAGTPVHDTLYTTLKPYSDTTYMFNVPFTAIAANQELKIFSNVLGDMNASNDTLKTCFVGLQTISVPWSDDFDSVDYWSGSCGNSQWDMGIPSAGTINTAHSGSNAWTTNLSGNYSPNMIDYLYSPYITIPPYADTATLEFWQWMDVFSTHAYGRLQYSINGGFSWINLGYSNDPASTNWHNTIIAGQHYWSLTTNGWIKSSYKLDPTDFNTGVPVQFRFEFISDGQPATFDGWAIDDFSVTIPPLAQDAGISQIINPVNQTTSGDTIVVKVEIKNFGNDTLTNIPIGYYISIAGSINEIWTGTLLPDSTTIFTFSTPYVAYNQDYDICAYTAVTGDNQPSNDTLCMNIQFLAGAKDAGITVIITPSGQTTIGNDIDVKATIQNFGTDTLYTIPLKYTFNGTPISQETYTGTLLPGATTDFTFITTYNSPGGIYHICVKTLLNGDTDLSNDSLCQAIIGTGIESHNINKFRVSQNRPNPANSLTTFTFFVPATGKVLFDLYNIMGKKMKSVELTATNGENTFTIDISSFTNGVYFSTFEYYGARIVKRIIITK